LEQTLGLIDVTEEAAKMPHVNGQFCLLAYAYGFLDAQKDITVSSPQM
jgi:hypothetical protein